MRSNSEMRRGLRVLCILFGFLTEAESAENPALLQERTPEDEEPWNEIADAQLSPDGHWFIYLLVSNKSVVVVRSTRDDTEYRYPIGEARLGAGNVRMSSSGRWIAFRSVPTRPQNKREYSGVHSERTNVTLVEVENGHKLDFEGMRAFQFTNGKDERIVLESYPTVATEPSFKLIVGKPGSNDALTIRDVMEYSLDQTGTRLAWSGVGGLQLCDLDSDRTQILDAASGKYQRLTWSDSGHSLAVLRSAFDSTATLLTFTQLNSTAPRRQVFAPSQWKEFPAQSEITSEAVRKPYGVTQVPLIWRDDEKGLFFGIRTTATRRVESAPTVPNLTLWHWQDERLPAQKKLEAGQRPVDLCFVSLIDGRFLKLTDAHLRDVEPHRRGRYVLGFDTSPYGWRNPAEGHASQSRDYYRIELRTGKRKLLIKELKVVTDRRLTIQPVLSPDGAVFLFQNNQGDYIAWQLDTGNRRTLTAGLPTRFYYPENNPQSGRHPRQITSSNEAFAGWAVDGKRVLIWDYYDVWSLSLYGGAAVNLTLNGRRGGIEYGLLPLLSSFEGMDRKGRVNLEEPLYFDVLDQKNAMSGLARRSPGDASPEILYMEPAALSHLKAAKADVYVRSVETSLQPKDYFLLDKEWRVARRLTNANPQERRLQRWAGTKRLSFVTSHGDALNATLHLPAGYIAGQTYPTLVNVYEELTAGAEPAYERPNGRQVLSRWLLKGYAVLNTNIRPRFNAAGFAALEAVTAAVEQAVAVGVADRGKLGLVGYSMGGYETYFIVSQTNLFKAAVPKAGMTNLWSFYGGIIGSGAPTATRVESSQPYLAGPWWENWEAYVQNSPLYHALRINTPLLIVHGDQDQAVPFSQAVELFNTLRRMGDKPVVLLQYAGENHVFSPKAQRDIDQRMGEFFDHFLKGTPAPLWWSEGVSYYAGEAPATGMPTSTVKGAVQK